MRGAAVWALSRLAPAARFSELAATHLSNEGSPEVVVEWRVGLTSA